MAAQESIEVVQVTHFNDLMWDTDGARVSVIVDGVVDPGHLYTGELPRQTVVVNDPIRRGRATGTDLLPRFCEAAPVDVFGMGADWLHGRLGVEADQLVTYDLPQVQMHAEIARRRVYIHPFRWTSLGLSLMEAMFIGMPIVCLNTTEAAESLHREDVFLSTSYEALVKASTRFLEDPDMARHYGERARAVAIRQFGIPRFVSEWDSLLARTIAGS
ncbi:glycosyltransferase [Clavibacter californiensis]|nr:glycosyltransferase [Clavibacter californiensis]